MKTSSTWAAEGVPWGTAVPLDANGYPITVPTGATQVSTTIDLDPASAGTSRIYELTWSGTANVSVLGTHVLSTAPGKIVFEYDGDDTWSRLDVSGLTAADPLTAIHVVRQDQVDLFDAGEIFNPALLDQVSHWSTLRFKDWNHIDGGDVAAWQQPNSVDNASWSNGLGVPIEVEVALANKTNTNLWINIPTEADDAYVRQTLNYVRANLDPTLTVKVEYSNEVWNWSYGQSHYALDMADRLWGHDVNGDGRIDPNDPAEHVADGWMRYYGYRSAQIAAIAHQVFAHDLSRVDTVVATQTSYEGLEESIIRGAAAAQVGKVSTLFDSWAVATYFGNEFDGFTDSDRTQVLAWARDGEAGMDAAFHELEFGGAGMSGGSLADLAGQLIYQGQVAKRFGMSMVAYEAGAHFTAWAYDTTDQPDVMAFFERLMSDDRMGEMYTKLAAIFNAAGGSEIDFYNDTSAASRFGDWGVLHSVYETSSERYDALVALTKQDVLAPVVTAESSYTLDNYSVDLRYSGSGSFSGNGNDFDNVIMGGAGADVLYGLGGNDTLIGGEGNDRLNGGIGADHMIGGAGNDTYYVDDPNDVVEEDVGGGTDLILTSFTYYTLGDNVENLQHVGTTPFNAMGNGLDNVITGGAGVNALYGLDGSDTLIGGMSNDVLDGGTGADRMMGGAGDDLYFVDNAADQVIEAPGEGNDEVRTTLANYTLSSNVERLVALGTDPFTGTGNELDNVITAGAGAAHLLGMAGNDTLVGGAGADLLDGGIGADHMYGGGGDDVYIVDSSDDMVVESPGQGSDTVRTALASYVLPNEVETLVFTGNGAFSGFGNASDNAITGSATGANVLLGLDGMDTLIGGAANDRLDGGAGIDHLFGGAGDDIYYVDDPSDVVVEAAQGGNDTVYSSANFVLPTNVETVIGTGSAAILLTGNELDNLLFANDGGDTMSALEGNDVLVGGAGGDVLYGNTGDDQIYGNAGADALYGGQGDDVLSGGDGDDVIAGNRGRDLVFGGAGADRFVFLTNDFAQAPVNASAVSTEDLSMPWQGETIGKHQASAPTQTASWIGNWADRIADFSQADHDVIDFRQIDANAGTAADDAFSFIGTTAFTHHAGELRVSADSGGYDVMGDTNGDGVADFHLWVSAAAPLTATDFLL